MKYKTQTLPLEDCLETLIDYRGKTPKKTEVGIPLITAKIIKNGIIETPTEFIAEDNYDAWMRRGLPKAGDVVLTVEAPLGEVAQLGSEKIALAQRVVTLRGKKGLLDNNFLLYLLQSGEMQELLKSRATGTTVLGIKQSELRKIPIALPSIQIQVQAASILKAIDNRIALLCETNQTLEAIAQAIFKSWFVDFDPVKAKTEGRKPEGMDDATTDLFPSAFTESSLGFIPERWEVIPFSEMIQLIGGGTPKTSVSEYWGGNIPWFSVADAPAESDVFVINTEKNITQSGLENSSARLLPTGTTIITARGTVGRIALVGVPMAMNQSCYGIRGIPGIGDLFIYYATKALLSRLKTMTHGSVFDTITRDTFTNVSFVRPPSKNIDIFESQVAPLFKRIQANLYNISTLKTIRDHLLPRLISGKLRVDEVSETVEALAL